MPQTMGRSSTRPLHERSDDGTANRSQSARSTRSRPNRTQVDLAVSSRYFQVRDDDHARRQTDIWSKKAAPEMDHMSDLREPSVDNGKTTGYGLTTSENSPRAKAQGNQWRFVNAPLRSHDHIGRPRAFDGTSQPSCTPARAVVIPIDAARSIVVRPELIAGRRHRPRLVRCSNLGHQTTCRSSTVRTNARK